MSGEIGRGRNHHFTLFFCKRDGNHILLDDISEPYASIITSGHNIKFLICDDNIDRHGWMSRRKRGKQRT
ncbi:hypothetical protein D3C71_2068660 [compost metagenome]